MHFPCETALLPHWQPELKQSPAWSGLITQSRSKLSTTNTKKSNFEGDCNPRYTRGKKNVGQSNYNSQSKCASPEGSSSIGEARAIVTRLELPVPPTMVVKKSRILWNEEKEKRLMKLYVYSSSDPSRGCARRLLEEWTLAFPEYSTTANALMKRVRLIKSCPMMTQTSNSDSQATAEAEDSSLPNFPAPKGLAAGEGGPYITTSAVGSEGEPTGTPTGPQGESEKVCMDSDPGLEELVEEVDQHYCQLLRDTNLRGRRSTKWPGVRVDGK